MRNRSRNSRQPRRAGFNGWSRRFTRQPMRSSNNRRSQPNRRRYNGNHQQRRGNNNRSQQGRRNNYRSQGRNQSRRQPRQYNQRTQRRGAPRYFNPHWSRKAHPRRQQQNRQRRPQQSYRQNNQRRNQNTRQYNQRRNQSNRRQQRPQRRQQQQRRQPQRRRRPAPRYPYNYYSRSLAISSRSRESIQMAILTRIRSRLGVNWVNRLSRLLGGVHGRKFANYLYDGVIGVDVPMLYLSDSDKIKYESILTAIIGKGLARRLPYLSAAQAYRLIGKYDAEISRSTRALDKLKALYEKLKGDNDAIPYLFPGTSATVTKRVVIRAPHKTTSSQSNGDSMVDSGEMKKILKMSERARALIRRIEHRGEERRLHGRTRKLIHRIGRKLKV
jgi:hypothetical protein